MNALPSEELRVARNAVADPLPAQAALRGRSRLWFSLWSWAAAPGVRQNLIILTVFWTYVACSNVLYANSMQASIAVMGGKHVFAPYSARLLQHLFLYPVLLGCVWASLHIGWQSLWRKLPLQLLLAFVFAALAQPAMGVAECFSGDPMLREHVMKQGTLAFWNVDDLPMWLATATTFLLAYGFALALVMGFAFYQRLRDVQLR